MLNRLLGAAVSAAVISCASAVSATTLTYDVHSWGDGDTHSFWFKNGPDGSLNPDKNKFLFENSDDGKGTFVIDTSDPTKWTARLTGVVENASNQGFTIDVSFIELDTPPDKVKLLGSKKDRTTAESDNANVLNWRYFGLDPIGLNSMTALPMSGLNDYDVTLRDSELAAQLGIAANDKDPLKLGFSSWTYFTQSNDCGIGQASCEKRKGDINIVLKERPDPGVVPLPAGIVLLPAGLVMLGALRRRRKAA